MDDFERERLEHLFWARVKKGDLCWEWHGARHGDGYGFTPGGRRGLRQYAHRFSWELHFGPIPAGLRVCHKCDNPPCVRPDHLFLGTDADNLRDMAAKGRQVFQRNPLKAARGERHGTHTHPETVARGSDHHNSRLTEAQVTDIRHRFTGAHGQLAQLAREFNVTKTNISTIVKGKSWAHLPVVKPEPVAPANGECQYRVGRGAKAYRCRRPWTTNTNSGWFCALHD